MPYRDRLPVLELEIATPCTARWEEMTGDDRVRHCGTCRKHVYDLASLTRDEAEALFEQHEGSACVRYFRRYDGTVILRDCTDGMRIRMPPEQIAFWVLLILVGSVSLIMVAWGCANQSRGFGGASLVTPRELRG